MEALNVFSTFTNAWAAVLADATAALMPISMGFCVSMAGMGLWLLIVSCMGSGNPGLLARGIKMLLIPLVYMVGIQHVQEFTEGALESVVQYGLAAGGGGGNAEEFLSSPDAIMQIGVEKFVQINELTMGLCTGWAGCVGAIHIAGPMFLASAAVLLSFGIAGFTIMSAALLFHVAKLAAILLLPLAIFAPLSSIGTGPIRMAFVFMVQVFVLVLVISVNSAVIGLLTVGETPGWSAALPSLIACLVFIGMLLGARSLAYSLTSGASMAAGALFGAPAGMAAAASRGAVGRVIATTPAGQAAVAGANQISKALNAPMPQQRAASQANALKP